MEISRELEELRRLFREGLEPRILGLVSGRRAVLKRNPEGAESIRRIAHALRGSGGVYGYPEITEVAALVEDAAPTELVPRCDALVSVLKKVAAQPSEVRQRILVVEDDLEIVRVLRHRLGGPGRELLVARTGAEAERKLESEDFDLVLLDLVLPDADGRNLLAKVRERPRTAALPVVVLSARTSASVKAECYALGADQFFEKPFDSDLFAASLAARLQRSAHLSRESRQDVLTRLPNRAGFREAFERAAALASRSETALALAILDFDRFKAVNDTYGHAAGDEVLRRAASGIAGSLRPSDVVARWGGDEFVVLLPGTDPAGAARALEKALEALRAEIFQSADGRTFSAGFTFGVALVARNATLEQALEDADAALYAAKQSRGPATVEAAGGEPGRMILLAEDDESTAALLRHRFRREGYEVVHCRDGLSAVEAAKASGFAICILDVRMPGLEGFEVLERIRATPGARRVPVIMLTALGKERDVLRGFELGADDYVQKPFQPNELMARVRRLVARGATSSGALSKLGGMAGSFVADQLIEFVQMLGLNAKTGVLSVSGDGLEGRLGFREGLVAGARTSRGGAGREAAQDLLALRHGSFEFSPEQPPRSEPELSLSVEGLLLEALRRRDEARAHREQRR